MLDGVQGREMSDYARLCMGMERAGQCLNAFASLLTGVFGSDATFEIHYAHFGERIELSVTHPMDIDHAGMVTTLLNAPLDFEHALAYTAARSGFPAEPVGLAAEVQYGPNSALALLGKSHDSAGEYLSGRVAISYICAMFLQNNYPDRLEHASEDEPIRGRLDMRTGVDGLRMAMVAYQDQASTPVDSDHAERMTFH